MEVNKPPPLEANVPSSSKVNEKHQEKPPDTVLPNIVDLLHTCELVTKQHPALCVKPGGKYSMRNRS